jgi:hypothetical protein
MPVNFVISHGGFIGELPEAVRKELQRRFPKAPTERIEREAMFYVLLRNESKNFPSLSKAKKSLRDLRAQATSLYDSLNSKNIRLLDHLIDLSTPPTSEILCVDPARRALVTLIRAVGRAEQTIPSGHTVTPRTRLVISLKSALEDAGMSTEPKGGSDLCVVTEIILDGLGELEGVKDKAAAARKVVSDAFGKRSKG